MEGERGNMKEAGRIAVIAFTSPLPFAFTPSLPPQGDFGLLGRKGGGGK